MHADFRIQLTGCLPAADASAYGMLAFMRICSEEHSSLLPVKFKGHLWASCICQDSIAQMCMHVHHGQLAILTQPTWTLMQDQRCRVRTVSRFRVSIGTP